MIVWTGWGILVVLIPLAIGVPIQLAVESHFGKPYYQSHYWPGLLICLLSAPPVWFLGRWLNTERHLPPDDYDGGESVPARRTGRHTFFFLPMEYWAYFIIGLAIYYMLDKQNF
jgi:hypothetical protein